MLRWLETWYSAQCDETWEHHRGVNIETLDNPGWLVKIALAGTTYRGSRADRVLRTEGDPPGPTNGNLGGPRWLLCEVRDEHFVGAGDETRLEELLVAFRALVEEETAP